MGSSSRASPPPPLDLRPPSRGRRFSLASPDSDDSLAVLQSQRRTVTGSSVNTNPGSFSPSDHKTSFGWVKASPTVNVYTTCGRHTDQMLFGGPSLRGLARALLGKKKE